MNCSLLGVILATVNNYSNRTRDQLLTEKEQPIGKGEGKRERKQLKVTCKTTLSNPSAAFEFKKSRQCSRSKA